MKQIYPLFAIIFVLVSVNQSFAQSKKLIRQSETAQPYLSQTSPEGNGLLTDIPLASTNRFMTETQIGSSYYDAQSYGCMQNRFIKNPDGTMIATWTMSQDQDTGFPTRGTGFNYFDGNNWQDEPLQILEEADRTGWPGICQTADGTIVSIHHSTTGDYRIRSLISNDNGSSWTESDITTSDPALMLWPRVAAGGPDGNTVHAIAMTTPLAFGGAIYEGVESHLLYYRSLDSGNTWETINAIIPGLDNTYALEIGADSYTIDVNGSTVAIAVFPTFADAALFKSTDNGDTWTKTIIDDFPLDGYVTDDGYTFDEIYPDGMIDPDSPNDSIAIETTDGAGSVLVDDNGMVHAWFGQMFVADTNLTDGSTSFFPTTSGLNYWNEAMGSDNHVEIANIIDENMNGMLDIDENQIASYFTSLTSHPSTGQDSQGHLYCAYSGITENFFDNNDDQHFRHIYLIKSEDGGQNWSEPFDVITSEFLEDLFEFTEGAFPYIPSHNLSDEVVDLVFMRDFKPGTNALEDDDLTSNLFVHLEINSQLVSDVEEVIEPNDIGFSVFPNPTRNITTLQFDLNESADVNVSIVDMTGKVVKEMNANIATGFHSTSINTSALAAGTYFIQLRTENFITTEKLVILK